MRAPLATLGVLLLLLVACGRPTDKVTLGLQSGPESRDCLVALELRAEVHERIAREHAAAVKARPAARAEIDRIRDDARRQIAEFDGLGPCEDNDPTTGVTVDLADLRQRFTVVADRALAQLGSQQPATGGGTGGSTDSGD